MKRIKEYSGHGMYCHCSVDEEPDPADFNMHTHEWYEIYMLYSGNASFLVEGTEYRLRKNDLMIMRSAEAHKLIVRPGAPYKRLSVHLAPSTIKSIDGAEILLEPFVRRPLGRGNLFRIPSVASAFDRFIDCPDPAADRAMLLSSVLEVLSAVYSAFYLREEQPDNASRGAATPAVNPSGSRSSAGRSSAGSGIVSSLIEYINGNLFSDFSIDELCSRFFMSRSQLERVFRRATGSSVWKYIQVKRLIAARERILAGEKVYLAALSCGFRDYSSFYRAYSAQFGHSPGSDRRNGEN